MFGATNGVLEERVAAVNDDVAGFQERNEVLDEFVDRRAGFDEHHDTPRALEGADHFLK